MRKINYIDIIGAVFVIGIIIYMCSWSQKKPTIYYGESMAMLAAYVKEPKPVDCAAIKMPEYYIDNASDTDVIESAYWMLTKILEYGQCIYLTNDGWVPTAKNPVTLEWAEYLLDMPAETAISIVAQYPCSKCPFTQLDLCPQCEVLDQAKYSGVD